ncbi:DUF6531 domain-containing protein [Actinoplanes sp. NPDC049596]|uniref:DUF6531 domain-containing protein n=1 Tax=unclassified Actinoplanes TaxID=2626549 RepID=UPI00344042CC
MSGRWLYIAGSSNLWRYDLVSGNRFTSVPTNARLYGGARNIAADGSYVYQPDGLGSLYRIDPATGATTQITATLPYTAVQALVSVGDFLYAAYASNTSPYTATTITRISKNYGTTALIAGSGLVGHVDGLYGDASFTAITGLASDGKYLFAADGSSLRKILKAKIPVAPGGPSLPGETIGGSNPSEAAPCNACHGDPVQTDTGALVEPATDVTVYDHGGTLSMSRTYGSNAASTKNALDFGWAWPYGMAVSQPSASTALGPWRTPTPGGRLRGHVQDSLTAG